ncbi:hypothetical protein KUTeg_015856 [Tegillarca granosa]|uniref:Uncharacterized protein n=1 Tax=Tegillarca granosa TaxID=220873 RepID=A0ABQ9ELR3_TEGGR|nr:hypothetical protein KUTeg_015856 [Tegillarca granosa]
MCGRQDIQNCYAEVLFCKIWYMIESLIEEIKHNYNSFNLLLLLKNMNKLGSILYKQEQELT